LKAVFLLQTDPYVPKPALRALREADALSRVRWDIVFVAWIKAEEIPANAVPNPYSVKRVAIPVPSLRSSFLRKACAYNRATKVLFHIAVEREPHLVVGHDLEVLRAAAMTARYPHKPLIYDSHEGLAGAHRRGFQARIAHRERPGDMVVPLCQPWGLRERPHRRQIPPDEEANHRALQCSTFFGDSFCRSGVEPQDVWLRTG